MQAGDREREANQRIAPANAVKGGATYDYAVFSIPPSTWRTS